MVTNSPAVNGRVGPVVTGRLEQFQMPVVAKEVTVNPGQGLKT
jgi:hypothetical protein